MAATWIARAAALLGFVAWALKAFSMAAAGGAGKSPLEDPFWTAGLILEGIACATLGVVLVGQRKPQIKFLGALVGLAAGAGVIAITQVLLDQVLPTSWGWFQNEAGLLVGALIILAVSLSVHGVRRRTLRRQREREIVAAKEQAVQDERRSQAEGVHDGDTVEQPETPGETTA
jgi:hypothetical protein